MLKDNNRPPEKKDHLYDPTYTPELEAVFDAVKDAIITVDITGRINRINDVTLELSGYSKEDFLGKRFQALVKIFPPASLGKLVVAFGKLLIGQIVEPYQIEGIAKSGEKLSLRVHSAIMKDKGRAVGTVTVLSDITKELQARREIEETMAKARRYLDIAGVIMLAIDRDERVTMINEKGCEVIKCQKEYTLGMNWFDNFVFEPQREDAREVFNNLISGRVENVEYFENLIITGTGEKRLIAWHNTLVKDSDGMVTGTLSSGEDITDRWKSEREVQSLAKFPEENPNPVLRISSDGTILYANTAARSILAHWTSEVGGKAPGNWRILVATVLETDQIRQVEESSGVWIFLITATPIKNEGYVNLYAQNITEARKMEKEQQRHLKELEIFYKASMAREDRILQLKDEVKRLKASLGKAE